MHLRLWITAWLAAFTAAAGQPIEVGPQPPDSAADTDLLLPPGRPPFGLACSECSLASDASCSALWISPVIAEASGAKAVSSNRQCYKGGNGATQTCDIVESVAFEQLHYFRPPPRSIADRFRVVHTTGDVPPEEAGIVFAPGRRYVVFAAPSDGALNVAAACPIEESRKLQ